MTDFSSEVIRWVRKIPRGKVATYGQIANLAGKPHGARGVGWILNSCARSHKLPWQRVINSKGRISFDRHSFEFAQQKNLLERENIDVDDFGAVALEIYGWSTNSK